jgi:HemY protein
MVLFATLQAAQALLSLPVRAREWRELKRERAAQALLREGFGEFLAARYARARSGRFRRRWIFRPKRTSWRKTAISRCRPG